MTATEQLFRDDAYLKSCTARVVRTEEGAAVLDRTICYAAGGGQPADTGALYHAGGEARIVDTVKGEGGAIRHLLEGPMPETGAEVEITLDWEKRHKLMRMHTALHLLSVVIPLPVSGGSIGAEKSRLDFDMPDAPEDKEALAEALNALITADHAVTAEWITDDELRANPGMVKTMSVMPPMGAGQVRLVRIGDIDLQPCGGTHVRSTAEIGRVTLGKIEKKGKQNRRVNVIWG